MTIFIFSLKRIFRNPTNLIFLTFFPLVAIFIPATEPWPLFPIGYQYFGILILFVSIRLTSNTLEDREKGIVKRLAVAPISHLTYLWQNLLAYIMILIVQCAIVIGGGVLYGQKLYQPIWLLVLYILFSCASLTLALVWNSLYRNKESSFLVFLTLIILMSVVGGLMMPTEMLPDALQRVAVMLPTYWLAEGLEWIALGTGKMSNFLFICGTMLLYTVLFLVLGSMRKIK